MEDFCKIDIGILNTGNAIHQFVFRFEHVYTAGKHTQDIANSHMTCIDDHDNRLLKQALNTKAKDGMSTNSTSGLGGLAGTPVPPVAAAPMAEHAHKE